MLNINTLQNGGTILGTIFAHCASLAVPIYEKLPFKDFSLNGNNWVAYLFIRTAKIILFSE
jgi:hypothetical protein